MPATDKITGAALRRLPREELPLEAGDVNAPRFEPNDEWLRGASPQLQKIAMWRWFATRFEDPEDPETAAPTTSVTAASTTATARSAPTKCCPAASRRWWRPSP